MKMPILKTRRRAPSGKRRGINIQEAFDRFDRVPNAGASYSLHLRVALPVAGNAGASMNFSGAVMAGHCFLTVIKENGPVRVTKSFGFYPAKRLSIWSPCAPYPSIIRDNRRHEVHAGIRMTINALDFELVRVLAIAGAGDRYRLLNFNCAEYALRIFNSVRDAPIEPPPYGVSFMGVPIGYNRLPSLRQMIIPKTPQGVYVTMQMMAFSGVPEVYIGNDGTQM
jgi:hypothetical protein